VEFADSFPEAILAMIGFADMGTPEGWYQTEIFSLSVPVAFIVVTVVVGSKALAGEEAQRTMGLLLANPISRSRVVSEKTVSMVGIAVIVGVLTYIGTMAGSLMAGLGLGFWKVAATTLLGILLALVFGLLALAIGAATGRVKVAAFGAAGAALAFYIMNGLLPLSDQLAGIAKWSPFYYFLTSDPLNEGMHWGHAGVLAGLCAVLFMAAIMLFDRRDLRQTG
jgi:ABC-2 type transport system permease protein